MPYYGNHDDLVSAKVMILSEFANVCVSFFMGIHKNLSKNL